MKTTLLKSSCVLLLSSMTLSMAGQQLTEAVTSMAVVITDNKTSTILFPTVIKNVDRGSSDVLAQKVNGMDNLLQLKAAKKQRFSETNLTVVTADGRLYHFIITFDANPKHLTWRVSDGSEIKSDERSSVIFTGDGNEWVMENNAKAIIAKKNWGSVTRRGKYKMGMALKGIYVRHDLTFYHIKVKNKSSIRYDIDMLRFYIKDRRNLKRTAIQELEVKPLYVYKTGAEAIDGNSTMHLVYVLKKFTIPDAKTLDIEMFEKNGGRHLNMHVKNDVIIKAEPVPEK